MGLSRIKYSIGFKDRIRDLKEQTSFTEESESEFEYSSSNEEANMTISSWQSNALLKS